MTRDKRQPASRNSKRFFDMAYDTTYYYANMIQNILRDQFGYLRNLDAFYGDQKHFYYAQPFQRNSTLHSFIHFCISGSLDEDIRETDAENVRRNYAERVRSEKLDPAAFWLDRMLIAHRIPSEGSLRSWAESIGTEAADISEGVISDYYEELLEAGTIETLCEAMAKEVFFLLFLNRELLYTFNEMMARQMSSGDQAPIEFEKFFSKPGVLKRVRIPRWVQQAVFYRDRGRCVFCQRDLSGIVSIDSPEHYDHIVSLANGGLNDVTNIQLLCSSCNLAKGAKKSGTSSAHELWYSYDSQS